MNENDIYRFMGELVNIEKISEIQTILENNASLLIAYPDSKREKSDEWLKKIDLCRIELRRRSKVAQGARKNKS